MIINVTFAFHDTLRKVTGIITYKQNAESYKTKLNPRAMQSSPPDGRQLVQLPPYCDSKCLPSCAAAMSHAFPAHSFILEGSLIWFGERPRRAAD